MRRDALGRAGMRREALRALTAGAQTGPAAAKFGQCLCERNFKLSILPSRGTREGGVVSIKTPGRLGFAGADARPSGQRE